MSDQSDEIKRLLADKARLEQELRDVKSKAEQARRDADYEEQQRNLLRPLSFPIGFPFPSD